MARDYCTAVGTKLPRKSNPFPLQVILTEITSNGERQNKTDWLYLIFLFGPLEKRSNLQNRFGIKYALVIYLFFWWNSFNSVNKDHSHTKMTHVGRFKMLHALPPAHQFVFSEKVLKEYDKTHSCKIIISFHLIPYVRRLHVRCMASKAYFNHRGCNWLSIWDRLADDEDDALNPC